MPLPLIQIAFLGGASPSPTINHTNNVLLNYNLYTPIKEVIKILDRKLLSDGIFFSKITDGRFKTNRIAITFYTEFSEQSRGDYAILPYILTDSCKKYPNLTRLTEKYSDLYGASVSDSFSCTLDSRSMTFSISCIDDRYTLNGEKLEEECCQLLLDCILDPLTENDSFDCSTVEIMRQELIDAIESVKGDKRIYAAQQAALTAYAGEPAGYPVNGTVEQARAITPRSAYNAWKNMLEHGRIEVFCTGCSSFENSERVFRERLSGLQRGEVYSLAPKASPLKPDVCRVTENMPMQQSILRMYFKAPEVNDRWAVAVLSLILGGMTTSRFFTNIREKQSLCYYCSCFSNRFKKTITVNAGVDAANLAKTERAVMTEFMSICMKGVTDEELEHAKLELTDNARAVYDSAGGITGWYSLQIADAEVITPEQYIEQIQQVTPQRVIEACRKFSLDTVYVLTPEEVE